MDMQSINTLSNVKERFQHIFESTSQCVNACINRKGGPNKYWQGVPNNMTEYMSSFLSKKQKNALLNVFFKHIFPSCFINKLGYDLQCLVKLNLP